MVDVYAGDAEVKKYLRGIASKEREEFSALTNRESKAADRSVIIKKMAQPREHMTGFFYAVGLIHGKDAAKYYEDYYYQARSDEGIEE